MIALLGVTAGRILCVNMQLDQEEHKAEVNLESFGALLCADPPAKTTMWIVRLARRETAKRIAAGKITNSEVLAEFGRVPEYVEWFYCRATEEGFSFTWNEPSTPPSLMN
jgi:hypothetical protein